MRFQVKFENRAFLNLRPSTSFGYIGLKNSDSSKIEVNKITPDRIVVEYGASEAASQQEADRKQAGVVTDSATSKGDTSTSYNYCYFRMPANSNKYWSIVDGGTVVCDATQQCAQQWVIELVSNSTALIRTYDTSSYLTLTNQGFLQVANCSPEEATVWEF